MRKHLNKIMLALGIVIIGGTLGWHHLTATPTTASAPITAFSAPDFNWQDMAGKPHALHDYDGKIVVLHFWASWCAPCRTEFPALLKTVPQQPNIIFLALSSDSDHSKAEKFLQSMGVDMNAHNAPANLLLGLDMNKKITYDLFMTSAYPETIILDKQHRLRRKIPNIVDWQSQDIQTYLQKLLAE